MRIESRDPDASRWPILVGGVAQAATFTALVVGGVTGVAGISATLLGFPLVPFGLAAVVGGVIGGATSERVGSEYVDGGGATGLGAVLSLVAIVAVTWTNLLSLSSAVRIDLSLLVLLFGTMGVVLLLPVLWIVGAVTGQASSVVRGLLAERS